MSRLADALLAQTEGVIALARDADLDLQVPTCPDWDLRRLLEHIGQAQRFGADVVSRRVKEPAELIAPTTIAVPEHAAALPEWLTTGAHDLVAAVRDAGADRPVWNFSGPGSGCAGWCTRPWCTAATSR